MRKFLRITLSVIAVLAALGAAGFAWLYFRSPATVPPSSAKVQVTEARIARGRYLFEVAANCDHCHSESDPTRFGVNVAPHGRGKGGLFPEKDLPGQVYAPNITPDPETGIGNWTDGEKIRAIRDGIGRDGRALFNLMPYQSYRYMSDDDVESLVAYLNALEPVRNLVPRTSLLFPVNLLIKGEPQPAGSVKPVDRSNLLVYGEYLVTIASCETCHTYAERGQIDVSRRFGGGRKFAMNNGVTLTSANISPDPDTGIGLWSSQRFLERFQAYRAYVRDGAPLAGPERFTVMPWLQFARMPDEDLQAIYTYLMTRVPVRNAVEKRTIARHKARAVRPKAST